MPILSWQDSYSVGVACIDAEHKQLISMINRAFDDSKKETDLVILERLAADMRMYAMVHFATEEELMKEHDFPHSEKHIKNHKMFLKKALEAEQAVENGEDANPIEFVNFLADWLSGHILEVDKALGTHLNTKGVY